MNFSAQVKFERWVKIRIGEPLTAVDSDKSVAIFGSISGYLGMYYYATQELKYFPDVFDEIIRGIFIDQHQTYITIGDVQGLTMNNQTKEFEAYKFSERYHTANLCSSTLTLQHKTKVLLMSVAPTQNKDIGIDISTKKNSLYHYNLNPKGSKSIYFDMPQLQVPLDFDGDRLLMSEYMKLGKKQLCLLTLSPQAQFEMIKLIEPHVEYVSHGRFYQDGYLYVENHKNLIKLDKSGKVAQVLKTLRTQIISLDLNEQQEITILDYDANVTILEGEKEIQSFNIFKVPNFPQELTRHKYIFDMGYPYYIRKRGDKLAITCDLGLILLSLIK